ncbi:hypothetical protein GOV08_04465 [Candidatus Woesearchaeota archaeon]|nr:hypothetical protein [Candidatus Woesearchaeota archaeon]
MKIYYDMIRESEKISKLINDALKNEVSIIDIFDKAKLVEKLWGNLKTNQKVRVKIDEKKDSYPKILHEATPRFIINNEKEKISFSKYLDKIRDRGFDIKIENDGNDIFLLIKKNKEQELDLGLKLDRDNTLDLSLMFENIEGVRSIYNLNKK